MSKLWNGKTKRIEVYERYTKRKVATFLADDACSISPKNTFMLNGEVVYWYDERERYYKSFDE